MSSWLFIRTGDLKPGGGLPLLILNHSSSVLCGRTRARFKTRKHTINKCFQKIFFLLLFLGVFNHLMFFQLFCYKCICPVLSPPDGWMAIKLNNLTHCPLATLKKINCRGYREVLYLEYFSLFFDFGRKKRSNNTPDETNPKSAGFISHIQERAHREHFKRGKLGRYLEGTSVYHSQSRQISLFTVTEASW